ncbi:hypothetical protein [Klebsiella oxytoca]|uniref:hypothetical protein n=1 Tax=Klebsiella oxytoca TaxID=571 RepID=UPI003F7E9B6E
MSNREFKSSTLSYVRGDLFYNKKHCHSDKTAMQKETDVKIIPALELSKMKAVTLEKAIRSFNDYVTDPSAIEKCCVRIYDYPFFNLHLEDCYLCETQRQLKKIILHAGYYIEAEPSQPPCIMITWPLPS